MVALNHLGSFISGHFPSLAILGAVVGGVFSVVKWYDIRSRELGQRNWSDYQEALDIVWGRDIAGQDISSARQLAALYRLVRFREFYFATVVALEEAGERNTEGWKAHVGPHARRVVAGMKKTWAYKRQAKKFNA